MRSRAKALTVVGVLCAFFASAAAASAACPNEGLRAQQQAGFLPDCRAYEMVSPVNKNGSDIAPPSGAVITGSGQAAAFGGGVMYQSPGSFDAPPSGGLPNYYLGERQGGQWKASSLNVPQQPHQGLGYSSPVMALTPDLSKSIIRSVDALVPGAPEVKEVPNLYVRDSRTGGLKLVTTSSAPLLLGDADQLVDASADFSHVLFATSAALTPGAPSGVKNLYEWIDGGSPELRLVGGDPEGEVAARWRSGSPTTSGGRYGAISDDGSRIFYVVQGVGLGGNDDPIGSIFVTENGGAPVEVSASQRVPPDPNGTQNATLGAVTPDGEYVFFTSGEKLTETATTGLESEGNDLYRYHVESGQLTDLTVDESPVNPDGADVTLTLAAGNDGSYVYFVATGDLAPGATAGEKNIYVWHEGQIAFIASGEVTGNGFSRRLATVSPNGRYLALVSTDSLTDFPSLGHRQVYLYDAVTDRLRCASCNVLSGSAESDVTMMHRYNFVSTPIYGQRYVLDNGSVFFDTAESLVPEDTNGTEDAYAYSIDGGLHLISSGRSAGNSNFYDASADGRDVFFSTRRQLVSQDADVLMDIYDARVEGGLPAQNELPPGPPCSGESCRGPAPAIPTTPTPGSANVSGPGNQASKRPAGKNKRHARKKRHASRNKSKRHAGKKGRARRHHGGARRPSRLTRRHG